MNRGKATQKMREKWKEQLIFLKERKYEIEGVWEIDFFQNIYTQFITNEIDLTIHQSFKLNQICNKYQGK